MSNDNEQVIVHPLIRVGMTPIVEDIELFMKGKVLKEDIQVETEVGTLAEIMKIFKDIEIGIDGMNMDLLTLATNGTTDMHPNTDIKNGQHNATFDQKTLLAIGQYLLNECATPLALEIRQPLPNTLTLTHEILVHQVLKQRRYNSLHARNLLRMHQFQYHN